MANNKNCELQDDAMSVFVKTLRKWRRKYTQDGDRINFIYDRKQFHADIDCENDSVSLLYVHDIMIDKDDAAKFAKLKMAVNGANVICNVCTFYDDNNVTDYIMVLSRATIYFVAENPNFEMELRLTLNNFYSADYLVRKVMKRKRNKRKKQEEIVAISSQIREKEIEEKNIFS